MGDVTQAIANQNLQAMHQYFATTNSEHTYWLPFTSFPPNYFFDQFGNGYEWDFSFPDGVFKELENKFTLHLHDSQLMVTRTETQKRFKASIKYEIKQSPWEANTRYDSIIMNSAIISFVNERITNSHLLLFNPESFGRLGTDTSFGQTNSISLIWNMDYSGIMITLNVTKIPHESFGIVLPNGNSLLTCPGGIFIAPLAKPAIASNATTNYAKYFLAEQLSDCKVVAGDKIFPAHRFVLIEISAFFETMFSTPMAENQNREWKIDDFDPVVVEEFLMFGYTGTCKSFTLTNKNTDTNILIELYRMGHKYDVEPLRNKSRRLLKGLVNNDNVFSIYHLGFLYGSKTLMNAAKKHFTRFKSQILHNIEVFRDLHKNYPDEMIFELTK